MMCIEIRTFILLYQSVFTIELLICYNYTVNFFFGMKLNGEKMKGRREGKEKS